MEEVFESLESPEATLHAGYDDNHMIPLVNVLDECYKNISTH